MFITSICYGRTVSGQNALKCDDIPDSLAALNISDNQSKSENEESHVINSPLKLESSFLNQGKEKVTVGHDNELECCDDALAALHISDKCQKLDNEGSNVTKSPRKLDSSLHCQGKDKVLVGDGNVVPSTLTGLVALPSTSGILP